LTSGHSQTTGLATPSGQSVGLGVGGGVDEGGAIGQGCYMLLCCCLYFRRVEISYSV
jgi:hypothetical protein